MSNLRDFYGIGTTGGAALDWEVVSANTTAQSNKGYMLDNSSAAYNITLPAAPTAGDTVAVGDLKGSFGVNNCTISRNGVLIQGIAEDLILDVKNQRVTLVYSGSTEGWIISELEPNNSQFEYMPYAVMHVQDQKPSGTAPGNATMNGVLVRTLNTTVKNDIAGASLAGNQVTLPAGTYSFESGGSLGANSAGRLMLYNSTSGLPLLIGNGSSSGSAMFLQGELTFAAQTVVDLRMWSNQAESLGAALGQGTEVYADLLITKIGGNYAPKPVISAARLQPMAGVVPNCQVQGFEITNTGANQLTVTKGQCLDSTLTTAIAVTGNTVLALDTTNNKLFTIAAVILNDGTHTCKVYDSEAAMAADVGVNITHFAFIGWWQNNGSGVAKAGRLFGAGDGLAELWWAKASENAVTSKVAPPAGCSTAVSLSSWLPSSDRVVCVLPGSQSGGAANYIGFGFDGTNTAIHVISHTAEVGDTENRAWSYGTDFWVPIINNTIYWGDGTISNTGTADIRLHATRFRR